MGRDILCRTYQYRAKVEVAGRPAESASLPSICIPLARQDREISLSQSASFDGQVQARRQSSSKYKETMIWKETNRKREREMPLRLYEVASPYEPSIGLKPICLAVTLLALASPWAALFATFSLLVPTANAACLTLLNIMTSCFENY
jgi:hypothetical protein